jgi:hypothetical protein
MLLEQVDECEQVPFFLSGEKWEKFSMGTHFWRLLPNIQ